MLQLTQNLAGGVSYTQAAAGFHRRSKGGPGTCGRERETRTGDNGLHNRHYFLRNIPLFIVLDPTFMD